MWTSGNGGGHAATSTAPARGRGWVAAILVAALAAALAALVAAPAAQATYGATIGVKVDVPTACYPNGEEATFGYVITNGPIPQGASVTLKASDGTYIIGPNANIGQTLPAGGTFTSTGNPAWPGAVLTLTVKGAKGGTHTVTFTIPGLCQPEPKVTTTKWVDGAKDCSTGKVTQTRTKVVTPYIWDGSKWILDTANAKSTTETQTRDMTSEELKACSTQPEPKVTTTKWVDGAKDCSTGKVTQTRTKVVTPYIWDGSKWILDTANAKSTTETQTRDMTSEELKACAGTGGGTKGGQLGPDSDDAITLQTTITPKGMMFIALGIAMIVFLMLKPIAMFVRRRVSARS